MKKYSLFTAAIALLLLLLGALWWLQQARRVTTPASSAPRADRIARHTAPSATPAAPSTSPTDDDRRPSPAVNIPPATPAAPSIEGLLSDPSLHDQTILTGLARITLDAARPPAERTEALGHLLNLSADEPASALLPLVADRRLPENLCNQILDDSLNAPLAWQADVHLAVLTHRKDTETKTKAREHLTFLLDADHGDNLAAWTQAVAEARATWTPDS